ncbi:LytR C-terminal domain-containing protein [Austwickia sp. TVS 96-490-7B]|uniref:LytR C-terminal domain-containing protein n=1 Tax=Austwickia sp. TVS 96-490-7B TaxID=2830843 RepID=UPI001C569C46|nr:LytR C-terminal domain-containing protein [Austwickia sp. TVS 96-490-7B]
MDPRTRTQVGIVAFVLTPGLVLGAGLGTASYALTRAIRAEAPSCQPVSVQGPLQNSFTLNVLNAGAKPGAAGDVLKELPLRSFKAGAARNDGEPRPVVGTGEIRYGADGLDQALVTQKILLPEARLVLDAREGTTVDLVLGPSFTQLSPHDGPLVRRDDVIVNIYNTTYFEGLGKKTADDMAGLGFRLGAVGLDPKNAWIQTEAAVRYGPDGERQAKLVNEAVPGSTMQLDPDIEGSKVDLLIGMKWTGVSPADKLPKEAPKKPLTRIEVVRPCKR